MQIGSTEWHRFLIEGAGRLGVEIDEVIPRQFSIHASELIKWNRKINLTTITQPLDMAVQHFLDSLAPAPFIAGNCRLLDIGSGAGFPGIPLKILKPSLSVLLIDGIRKKVNFLKHILRILKLESIEARQIRAENLHKDLFYVNSFDVIISRALSDLESLVKSALPLLAKQGTLIAMKGEVNQQELETARSELSGSRYSLKVEKYRLPFIESGRSLVMISHLR